MDKKHQHHHIEHFRGARLVQGDQVLIDQAEGELTYRERAGGRKEWHGFLEVPNAIHIESGVHLKLELADGRTAEINAADIRGSEVPGRTTHAVEFYVCGDLHLPGRPRLSASHSRPLGH